MGFAAIISIARLYYLQRRIPNNVNLNIMVTLATPMQLKTNNSVIDRNVIRLTE